MDINYMNAKVIEFTQIILEDEDLKARLEACQNPDEAYALAMSVTDGFTKEEFVETMKALNELNSDELSADELADVAGGDAARIATTITFAASLPVVISTSVVASMGGI